MSHTNRTEPVRRAQRAWGSSSRRLLLAATLAAAQFFFEGAVAAHEGHDHDKPAPLNLPVAPRVVAVTPEYELVGVLSGEQRLTIFLHHFATGEPVKNAKISVSGGDAEAEAVAKEDGIFEVTAAWLRSGQAIDLIFKLTLPEDQDILTGRLERASVGNSAEGPGSSSVLANYRTLFVGIGALMVGVLLTLLVSASVTRRGRASPREASLDPKVREADTDADAKVKQLRRAPLAVVAALIASAALPRVDAKSQTAITLPSVPATMATDVPQRMADGSLFVPKATQHLLAVRTVMTAESRAPRTVQLVGAVIADPNSFGRVQTGHSGRIEAPNGGLAFVGKRVEKGEVLAFLQHHIEAYNKGNLQGEIAELEARIALQEAKLARYLKAPLAIPPIKIDEAKGEIHALRQKRKELMPTLVEREEIRAPISGVLSVSNVVAGQVVDAREVLFEIVDPARYWVEAIAHDPSVVSNLSAAFAVTNNGEKLPLEFAGLGLSLKQQVAPVTFRVRQFSANLSIGKPVTVILQSSVELSGIVLPAASVVRAPSGLATVWVKTEPERFEPHTVRYEALDGQRVVVTAGLKLDVRVVTDGATLLNQIR
jgi:cobalt-zinc-cadmium efflux system membrane fusion protein